LTKYCVVVYICIYEFGFSSLFQGEVGGVLVKRLFQNLPSPLLAKEGNIYERDIFIMKELTEKQKRILEFLVEYTKNHGYPPTVREIGNHFRFLWAAARGHLQALERKGFIKLKPGKSRGIEIPGFMPSSGFMLPVAGKIRAGKPILAREDIDAHILVDKSLFPHSDSFSLRVTGDSMIEVGILNGDYVVVRPQKTIENGEIGVVLIEDEATIKRVFREKKKIVLKPENKDMKPTTYNPNEVTIIGKVIGVIRKI
jgi:repressor LexA